MNAISHSKFNLSIADLIKADQEECADIGARDEAGLPIGDGPLVYHPLLMARRCTTLAEVRAKLAWMIEDGTGLTGEEEAFELMLADLDRLMAEAGQ